MKKAHTIFVFMFCVNFMFAQWETVYHPLGTPLPLLNAVEFYDYNKGVTVGNLTNYKACILTTINNGTNWDTVYISTDTLTFNDVTMLDANTIVAVGSRNYCCNPNIGIIAKSTNFGATWTTIPTTIGLNAVSFSSTNTGYASGSLGSILKTINGGNTWTTLNTGVPINLGSVYFVNDLIGFACGIDTIIKTTNGGITWSIQTVGNGNVFNKIFFPSANVGYCSTTGCFSNDLNIYKTNDQGVTWNFQSTTTGTLCILSAFFTDDTTGYIAGQFNVSKTINSGVTWNAQTADPPAFTNFFDDIMDVYFINKDTGFVVGVSQFYRTNSAGVLSVDDVNDGNEMDILFISPNPANDFLSLNFPKMEQEHLEWTIYNTIGELKYSEKELNAAGTKTMDISGFTNGIYFVRVTTSKAKVYQGKLVIVK